jgi:hypothetical protein
MKKLLFTALVFAGISATAQVKVGTNPTTLATNANFQVEGTTTADQLVVLKNGNVGVGTSAPAKKLDVNTATNSYGIQHTDGTINLNTYVGGTAGSFGTQSNHSLVFYTNDINRVFITTAGKVGIGTNVPYSRLSNQTVNIVGSSWGTDTNGLTWASAGSGFVAGILNTGTTASDAGLVVKVTGTAATNHIIEAMAGGTTVMTVAGNGNVGIGTATPDMKLTIKGSGDTQDWVDATGAVVLSTYINSTRAWIGTKSNHPFSFQVNYLTKMTLDVDGSLAMNSGATCTVGGAWVNASDRRLKQNIVKSNYGLAEVLKLNSVQYEMIKSGEKQVGFIAQEVQKIVPEVVYGKEGDMAKGETLGVSYQNLVPVLVNAIKEQQAQIEALKAEVAKLKK